MVPDMFRLQFSMFLLHFCLCSILRSIFVPVQHLRFSLCSVYVTDYVPSTVLTGNDYVLSVVLSTLFNIAYVQSISVSVMSPFCKGSIYVLLTVLSSQISHFLEGIPMVDKH